LKQLTLAWAQTHGFAICATEVQVPRSGFRADVAAIGRGPNAATAVFECKQARADLLKDAHAEAATRARLEELTRRRHHLEGLIAGHLPDLRRGDALWPEFDSWDFSGLDHRAYRSVLEELETLQRRVLRGTKFSKMFRYHCADFLYLVVEENIFAESEIPAGWGLLVRGGGAEGAGDELRLARAPARLDPTAAQRVALLETIALAGTRAVNRLVGRDVAGGRVPAARAADGKTEREPDGREGTARHLNVIVR
jgi:hypothetical protein